MLLQMIEKGRCEHFDAPGVLVSGIEIDNRVMLERIRHIDAIGIAFADALGFLIEGDEFLQGCSLAICSKSFFW